MAGLRIGALASRMGTNAPTIRYYEEIGLLPRAHRRSGGQRIYSEEDVTRLTFIRRCRGFGFSIAACARWRGSSRIGNVRAFMPAISPTII
jgi:DNA-binding transcriptional MerR regulator